MKVGPTVRICLSPPAPVVVSAVAAGGAASAGAAPFLAAVAGGLPVWRCCIRLALSSVTMMSPCSAALARSSIDFSASAQVWPGALHEQDGLNSVRYLNAFGSAL